MMSYLDESFFFSSSFGRCFVELLCLYVLVFETMFTLFFSGKTKIRGTKQWVVAFCKTEEKIKKITVEWLLPVPYLGRSPFGCFLVLSEFGRRRACTFWSRSFTSDLRIFLCLSHATMTSQRTTMKGQIWLTKHMRWRLVFLHPSHPRQIYLFLVVLVVLVVQPFPLWLFVETASLIQHISPLNCLFLEIQWRNHIFKFPC